MPKISVIIPVYNTEKYLAACLDSVLAQTFADIEIICINDGSTDRSGDILAKYAKKDKRIRVITQTNKGVVASRNIAIKDATGEYIYTLDSDDIIDSTTLEKSYNAIMAGKGDIITTRVGLFGDQHGEMFLQTPTKFNMAQGNCLVNAALFSKAIFIKSGGFDTKFRAGIEDYDFWLNLVYNHNCKIYRIPEILFFYRIKSVKESRNEQQKNACNNKLLGLINKKYPIKRWYRLVDNIRKWLFQIRCKNKKLIVRCFKLPVISIRQKSRLYLFDLLPVIRINCNEYKFCIKIFAVIPIFSSIKYKSVWVHKLFCILPIFYTNESTKLNTRYKKHIEHLKHKNKIRVGFFVWENSKWSYDSIYSKLAKDSNIEPIVLIVAEDNMLCDIGKNIAFFKKYNYCVIKNVADFKAKNIDIVFYEQPWFALSGDFTPRNISKYSITLYVPYGIELDTHHNLVVTTQWFLKSVYCIFTFDDKASQELLHYGIANTKDFGHPRLDTYLNPASTLSVWKNKHKIKIIYAPHHSFADSVLKQATWDWNGQYLLRLAQETQDIAEWVFKPHPRFKLELSKLLGDPDKAETVFNDWAKVATICDSGDYFDVFKTADLMISDCCSFKIEWLPTGKPYIDLVSQYADAYKFKLLNHYAKAYYKANNIKELQKWFDLLVYHGLDPKYNERLSLIDEISLNSTDKIYGFLKNIHGAKK